MIARIFDALNDPFMGIVVAKTKTKWGRFRPWLFTGTVLNAFVLYALYAAPNLKDAAMMIFFTFSFLIFSLSPCHSLRNGRPSAGSRSPEQIHL